MSHKMISHKIYNGTFSSNYSNIQTPMLDGITTLHHDIMTYLVLIIVAIVYLLIRIILLNRLGSNLIWSYARIMPLSPYFSSKLKQYSTSYYDQEVFLEILWTVIPLLLLILIGSLTMSFLYNTCNYIYFPNNTLIVTGHQWYWSYDYNELDVQLESYLLQDSYLNNGELRMLEVDNRLLLPARSHVRLFITSDDVIHSWAIPSLGIKLDANPGRMNHCHIFTNMTGIYYGQCSELCGVGHAYMPVVLQSIPLYVFKRVLNIVNTNERH